jgi:hypothetical protein
MELAQADQGEEGDDQSHGHQIDRRDSIGVKSQDPGRGDQPHSQDQIDPFLPFLGLRQGPDGDVDHGDAEENGVPRCGGLVGVWPAGEILEPPRRDEQPKSEYQRDPIMPACFHVCLLQHIGTASRWPR